jgi:hypothetical protein
MDPHPPHILHLETVDAFAANSDAVTLALAHAAVMPPYGPMLYLSAAALSDSMARAASSCKYHADYLAAVQASRKSGAASSVAASAAPPVPGGSPALGPTASTSAPGGGGRRLRVGGSSSSAGGATAGAPRTPTLSSTAGGGDDSAAREFAYPTPPQQRHGAAEVVRLCRCVHAAPAVIAAYYLSLWHVDQWRSWPALLAPLDVALGVI